MFKFKNKAFIALLLLLAAQLINDWWVYTIGIPSPVQIILVGSIVLLSHRKCKKTEFLRIRFFIVSYLVLVTISFLRSYPEHGLNGSYFSIIVNFLFLFIVQQNLYRKPIEQSDLQKFFKYSLLIILIISGTTGLIEIITHKNIITALDGLSANLFYIRGLHIDKVDYASYLVFASFITLSAILAKNTGSVLRVIYIVIIVFDIILVILSFSSTSIIGQLVGLTAVFVLAPHKTTVHYAFIGVFIIAGLSLFVKTEIAEKLMNEFSFKYQRQVVGYESGNFRYSAFVKSMESFAKAPLIGHGFAMNQYVLQEKLNLQKPCNSHNFLANELIDNGAIGTFPIFWLIVITFVVALKSLRMSIMYGEKKLYNYSFVSVGFSAFILLRLMLYFHRFDNTIYLIWFSVVYAIYNFYKQYSIKDNPKQWTRLLIKTPI